MLKKILLCCFVFTATQSVAFAKQKKNLGFEAVRTFFSLQPKDVQGFDALLQGFGLSTSFGKQHLRLEVSLQVQPQLKKLLSLIPNTNTQVDFLEATPSNIDYIGGLNIKVQTLVQVLPFLLASYLSQGNKKKSTQITVLLMLKLRQYFSTLKRQGFDVQSLFNELQGSIYFGGVRSKTKQKEQSRFFSIKFTNKKAPAQWLSKLQASWKNLQSIIPIAKSKTLTASKLQGNDVFLLKEKDGKQSALLVPHQHQVFYFSNKHIASLFFRTWNKKQKSLKNETYLGKAWKKQIRSSLFLFANPHTYSHFKTIFNKPSPPKSFLGKFRRNLKSNFMKLLKRKMLLLLNSGSSCLVHIHKAEKKLTFDFLLGLQEKKAASREPTSQPLSTQPK